MKTLISSAIFLSIALSGVAGANEPYDEKPLDANTAQTFQTSAASVRSELRPGGRYAFVNPAERAQIDAALSDIDMVYSTGLMGQDAKVRVFNDQELVNSILEQRGDRLVCANEVSTGSLVRETKCHTIAQELAIPRGSMR
jgi:hypothetical protein